MFRFFKYFPYFFIGIFILNSCTENPGQKTNDSSDGEDAVINTEVTGTLNIFSDDVILPVADELGKAFNLQFPSVKVNTSLIHSESTISMKSGESDIILSSLPVSTFETEKFEFLPLACDVLTMIVNFNNTELQTLVMHGISVTSLKNIFFEKTTDWSKVHSSIKTQQPLKAYIPPVMSGSAEYLAALTGIDASAINISDTPKEKDVLKNVEDVQVSLGFCSHTLAYDFSTGFRKSSIYIIGIDWNNSGTLENNELIWDDTKTLKDAYLKNILPEGLVRTYSAISVKNSKNTVIKHFLDFLSRSGPEIFEKYGFYSIQNKTKNNT